MKVIFEVGITTVLLVILSRFLYGMQDAGIIGQYYATIFAVAFLYVPVMVMWWCKRKIDFLDASFGMFLKGFVFFVAAAAIIFPLYLLGAHFWMKVIADKQVFRFIILPDLWKVVVFQLFLIALPEEFFFRGYMQGAFNLVFRRRWNILGARMGLAWPLTALVFALSHSVVHYAWWHFSIFFPALLFGWLRERTGSITAPILFHAVSNIISDWAIRCYL